MNQNVVPSLKITLAMIIVGSSVVVGKLVVQRFPVFLASELRFLIAVLIMVPILIKMEGFPNIKRRDFLILFLQSLFGVFLFNIFMLYGLQQTTAIEAGMITSSLPAVTGCLSFLLLKERLTKHIRAAILLAVVGIAIIHLFGTYSGAERGLTPLLGNLLIGGAVISESVFIICGKLLTQRVSPLVMATIISAFGAVFFSPLALYEASQFHFAEVSIAEWGFILYFAIVVTVVAFILMYQGVAKVSASTAGVLTAILPISSLLFAVLILDERFTLMQLLGICFVLTAILVISRKQQELR